MTPQTMTPATAETMQRTASPPFNALGVMFQAYAVREGDLPGATRVVWISDCGRVRCGGLVVVREPKPTDADQRTRHMMHWARIDGALIGSDYRSLRAAMESGAMRLGAAVAGKAQTKGQSK